MLTSAVRLERVTLAMPGADFSTAWLEKFEFGKLGVKAFLVKNTFQ